MTGLNVVKVLAAVAVVAGGVGVASPPFGTAPSSPASPAAPKSRPNVDVIHPRRATLAQRLQSNATLEAFEEADLFAKISGYLSEVRVDIGDHVKAGQILAVIWVPETEQELAEAEAQLEAQRKALETAGRQVDRAQADLALQEVTFKRMEILNRQKWTTDQALDDIRAKAAIARADLGLAVSNRDLAAAQVDLAAATVEKDRALLGYAKIVAPFDGVIAQRRVNRGDLVQTPTASRTMPLFKIQRIDTIRVFSDVPEDKVAQVRVGDPATALPTGSMPRRATCAPKSISGTRASGSTLACTPRSPWSWRGDLTCSRCQALPSEQTARAPSSTRSRTSGSRGRRSGSVSATAVMRKCSTICPRRPP